MEHWQRCWDTELNIVFWVKMKQWRSRNGIWVHVSPRSGSWGRLQNCQSTRKKQLWEPVWGRVMLKAQDYDGIWFRRCRMFSRCLLSSPPPDDSMTHQKQQQILERMVFVRDDICSTYNILTPTCVMTFSHWCTVSSCYLSGQYDWLDSNM